MTLQELETQLLKLNPSDRLRIIQSVIQSLIPNAAEPNQDAATDLTRDRSPHHPLRNIPLIIREALEEYAIAFMKQILPLHPLQPQMPIALYLAAAYEHRAE